jgi:hypothetical protein
VFRIYRCILQKATPILSDHAQRTWISTLDYKLSLTSLRKARINLGLIKEKGANDFGNSQIGHQKGQAKQG